MNTAPVYIVSFANGSAGSFISAIIERLCSPWITNPIVPGKHNSAHRMMVKPNYRSTRKQYGGKVNAKEYFAGMERIMVWHPTFIETHFFSPKDMIEKFPESKILAITLTEEDIEEVAINSFFKFIVGEANEPLPSRAWNYLHQSAFFIADSISLKDIEDNLPKYLEICTKIRQGDIILSGFHLIEDREKYGDNVTFLPYSTITNKPEEALEILSKFTDKPITDYVRTEFMLYIERQRDFIQRTKEMLSGR